MKHKETNMSTSTSTSNGGNLVAHAPHNMRHIAEQQTESLKGLMDWEKSIKKLDMNLSSSSSAAAATNVGAVVLEGDGSDIKSPDLKAEETENGWLMLNENKKDYKSEEEVVECIDLLPPSSYDKNQNNNDSTKEEGEKDFPTKQLQDRITQERMKGNEYYSKGEYKKAIKSYSFCIEQTNKDFSTSTTSPSSSDLVLAYSNRAMTYLKLKEWSRAESDAISALKLDPSHIKSYQRRSLSRKRLGKYKVALRDIKLAQQQFSDKDCQIYKALEKEEKQLMDLIVKCIHRAPMRRNIPIQEIVTIPNKSKFDEKKPASKQVDCSIQSKCSSPSTIKTDQIDVKENKNKENLVKSSPSPSSFTAKNAVSSSSSVTVSKRTLSQPPDNSRKPTTRIMNTPQSWVEFQMHWKSFQNSVVDKRTYLLVCINPPKLLYTKIFKFGIEEDVDLLIDILRTIQSFFLKGEEDKKAEKETDCKPPLAIAYLEAMSKIPKLDICAMMMTQEQKDIVNEIIDTCFCSPCSTGDDDQKGKKKMKKIKNRFFLRGGDAL